MVNCAEVTQLVEYQPSKLGVAGSRPVFRTKGVVMTAKIKKIDIKEFLEEGFLQEANRQFFHPLGLALEVAIADDGKHTLSGVWDYRDDPEGMLFGEGMIDMDKVKRVGRLHRSKSKARDALGCDCLGIQMPV